jgi:outer membrane protein assembly factor BamB
MSRRAWVVGLLTGVVLLAGLGAVAVDRWWPRCGEDVVGLPAGDSTSPFLDARERSEQPDRDRDALVAALTEAPAPFGEVVGAVGYHYEQWAQVDSFAQGVGVRTRDNPDFTMLDDRTLEPRWSVEVRARRSAYDASERRYLVATLPADRAPEVVALDAGSGARQWCTDLDGEPVGAGDAFATQFATDGGVVVLTGGAEGAERLTRLAGRDGEPVWTHRRDADAGDFLGDLGQGVLLAGGEQHELLVDPVTLADRTAGQALVAVSVRDGEQRWSRRTAAGSGLHVVGTDPDAGLAILEEWSGGDRPRGRLLALDRDGETAWSVRPPGRLPFDATLRAGRVLVRSGTSWAGYDATDGRRLWQRRVPGRPQFLPYGFQLDSVPLLDGDHVLVGGTTALHTLDLRDGSMTAAPLPTDGINTTYWPYQLAATDRLIAVATNTGAAVVRRE